jgi:hypothetical protein
MTTWARAAIAAAAINCCGVMTAATAAADRPDYDLSHHPAPAVAPGVGIGIDNADGKPTDTCTAGWLVHDSSGQQLCHYGLITGPQHRGPECGPITDVGPAKVKFLAPSKRATPAGLSITPTPTAPPLRSASPSAQQTKTVAPLPN